MTKLQEWLDRKRMSHAEFAKLIGADRSSVTRYAAAGRMPRRGVLARISEVTGGAVCADDFVTDAAAEHCGEPHRAAS